MEEESIKDLLNAVRCGACGQELEFARVDVMGQMDGVLYIQAVCGSCGTPCLIAVVQGEKRLVRMVSDLTDAEFDKFQNSGPPAEGEIRDMHDFLQSFDGNFARLFSLR